MKVVVITKNKITKPSVSGFKVHNYLWQEFGNKDLNLRDYDGVILDLTGVDEKASEINWAAFTKVLNYQVTKDVLLEESSFIIVVGNPFVSGGNETVAELLGVKLSHIEGKGDSIKQTRDFEKSEYKKYLQNVKTYEYSFSQPVVISKIKTLADSADYKHAVDTIQYLVTRAGKIIAGRLYPVIYNTFYDGSRNTVHYLYQGKLVLLPSSGLDPSETARLLLEANKGNEGDNSKPEWLSAIEVVGEKEVGEKILEKQKIIEETTSQKDVLLLELADLRKPLDIIYKSDKSLEESVKDLLRSIGATVIEPKETDKVDFYITYENLKFAVEVKSTVNANIDQKALRQAVDWQNDAFDQTGDDYKPLVIASVQYDKPLKARNAEILPSNLIDYSEKKKIAVISAVNLYKMSQDITKGDESIETLLGQLDKLSGVYEYDTSKREPEGDK